MDGQKVIIGYGPGSRFRDSHKQNRGTQASLGEKQSLGAKVDIFNGEEFIGTIPLKVLTRFSEAGKRVFPRPQQQSATKATSSRKSAITSVKINAELNWADDANAAHENAADAQKNEKSYPGEQQSQAGDRVPVTAPVSLAFAKPKMTRRTLQLKLNVVEMPSRDAVSTAIKWMEDNESSEGRLIDFGPTKLEKIKLFTLIDLYQAALAFELRPWGKVARVRTEICKRVSDGRLDIRTFKQLSRWLPAEDPVIVRCINSMEYHRGKRAYSAAEIEDVTTFLQLSGNEKLDAKFAAILDKWRMRREARREQRNDGGQQDVEHVETGGSEEVATEAVAADHEPSTKQTSEHDQQLTPRRRDRRAQKATGKHE